MVASSFVAVAGCGVTGPSGRHAGEQARLDQARAQWRAQAIVDYRFVFSRGCFCVTEYREPVTVTVRGRTIESVVSVAGGVPRETDGYATVEGLFDLVQNAIDEDADGIRTEYDPARGYLKSAYLDISERIADEELSFEVQSLTPLD
ncbi:MAG: DUF6174 domain-containing protein [Vicinamibacteria bacterium]